MSLPGSSSRRSANGLSLPSASSSVKGKGKAREVDVRQTGENGHDSTSPQDYDEAMRAALVDDGESDNGGDGGGQGAQDDADATFIYNGRDDEDTQDFIKDASLEHRSYRERLRGVLEGDEDDAPAEGTSSLAVRGRTARKLFAQIY